MINLSDEEFNAWAGGSTVLRDDGNGNQVLLTTDDRIIRVARSRLLPDSTAKKFAAHAGELQSLGIRAPDIDGVFRCRSEHATLVMYKRLEHDTLRNLLKSDSAPVEMLPRLSPFLAEIHDKGVYAGSLDLGGIVYAEDLPYALIDLREIQCTGTPLTVKKRIGVLSNLLAPGPDREALISYGLDRFLSEYLDHAAMEHSDRIALVRKLPEGIDDPQPVRTICDALINRSVHPG